MKSTISTAMLVVFVLTVLTCAVEAQARIVFHSWREGNAEIYVMDTDGANPQNLTNNPADDLRPAWLGSAFAVAPAGKKLTIWGGIKATR